MRHKSKLKSRIGFINEIVKTYEIDERLENLFHAFTSKPPAEKTVFNEIIDLYIVSINPENFTYKDYLAIIELEEWMYG